MIRRQTRRTPAPRTPRPLVLALRRAEVELVVPERYTALEALEHSGVEIASMCRAGICGTCEIRPLAVEFAPGIRPPKDGPPAPVRLCVTTGGAITRLILDL